MFTINLLVFCCLQICNKINVASLQEIGWLAVAYDNYFRSHVSGIMHDGKFRLMNIMLTMLQQTFIGFT